MSKPEKKCEHETDLSDGGGRIKFIKGGGSLWANVCPFCNPAPLDGVKPTTYTDDDFKYYTDTIVRIMKNAICKKGSTPNDAIDELNSFFASALNKRQADHEAAMKKFRDILRIYGAHLYDCNLELFKNQAAHARHHRKGAHATSI